MRKVNKPNSYKIMGRAIFNDIPHRACLLCTHLDGTKTVSLTNLKNKRVRIPGNDFASDDLAARK
jgi:hypothetical protein